MEAEAFSIAGSSSRRAPGPVTIGLDSDALTLGGFVLGTAERFDELRAAALLAAAYGDAVSRSALANLRGAVRKRREGDTPLALTYLALAGLPPLADAAAVQDRLWKANALMEAGVAPSTIVEALAPRSVDLVRAYNPDQPRVPAGNGEISGQWTSGDAEGATSSSRRERASELTPVGQTAHTPGILVADNSPNWAQYLSPVSSAEAAERDGKPFNGRGPNDQRTRAVAESIANFATMGFAIASPDEVRVKVSGFDTPRIYDFAVQDLESGELIGVEVKSTKFDTIFFNPFQVEKDVAIYETGGAYVPELHGRLTNVAYDAA